MADTRGYRELSRQLAAMARAPAGKALRSAALSAMLPALREAQKNAPRGEPPYDGKDPYPIRTHKGTLRTPGFASRNVARKTLITRDKTFVKVMLGVKPLAFYALQFIEFGTSKIPKRPWLEPSFRRSIPKVDQQFRARLKALIDKAAR